MAHLSKICIVPALSETTRPILRNPALLFTFTKFQEMALHCLKMPGKSVKMRTTLEKGWDHGL